MTVKHESISIEESFVDYGDAFMFFEHHLMDHQNKNWTIKEALIRHVNSQFQVFMVFEKLYKEIDQFG
ncbi:MAG: hypothetical protein AB7W16_15635 [Candidatus Obscuribacterales bacterium]